MLDLVHPAFQLVSTLDHIVVLFNLLLKLFDSVVGHLRGCKNAADGSNQREHARDQSNDYGIRRWSFLLPARKQPIQAVQGVLR
jgi:hypothetical protein